MAFRNKTNLTSVIVLVFGVAFGLVALAMGFQAVKTSQDVRSRAATEGDVYKSWEFQTDKKTEGWRGVGTTKLTVKGGSLQFAVPKIKRVPSVTVNKVATAIPTGKKFLVISMAVDQVASWTSGSDWEGRILLESVAELKKPQSNEDPDFASAVKDGLACTQEVQACPDGSYVGRIGPSCAFAPCPSVPTPTPKKKIYTSPSVPGVPTRTVQVEVYYKLIGAKKWAAKPITGSMLASREYQRLAIPFPQALPEGGPVTIDRLRISFASGLAQGDTARIDQIQLVGPFKNPTNTPTVTPTPPPTACGVTLQDIRYSKPEACSEGASLGAWFTCSDGYAGSIGIGGITCMLNEKVKLSAEGICARRCGKVTQTPSPTGCQEGPTATSLIKPEQCQSGYALGMSYICPDGVSGSVGEGTTCRSLSSLQSLVSSACASHGRCLTGPTGGKVPMTPTPRPTFIK